VREGVYDNPRYYDLGLSFRGIPAERVILHREFL
jgi:hypothetical protein